MIRSLVMLFLAVTVATAVAQSRAEVDKSLWIEKEVGPNRSPASKRNVPIVPWPKPKVSPSPSTEVSRR